MLRYLLVALLALAPVLGLAQTERHSEVRLYLPAAPTPDATPRALLAERLAAHGLLLDHAHIEVTPSGSALRTVLSASELRAAEASGVELEVLVEDVTAHYLATRRGTCEGGASVSRIEADICGTMGGYPTFETILGHLDAMRAAYPHLISERTSLGETHEGRPLWLVEISDNPGVEEGEPEALYTGLHHAREPGSMAAVLYFMYYLLENYGTDPEVTELVDSRRLFFVPVVNPDGYVFNETTNPEGGGMWRKNRRDNGGNVFGVDLNRNYGYEWGYDDLGSSGFPPSETYRGPAPFSEPETRALRDFLEGGRHVSVAFNYHTHGNLLLFPWGYRQGVYTPDHAEYVALGEALTEANGYTSGPSPDVLYLVNGGASDWFYGEQTTKGKIMAFLPEVGYAFWPDPVDVYALADENLEANLLLAQAASPPPVSTEPSATARPVAWDAAYPNPFTDASRIAFTTERAGPVRLAVFDVLGREVRTLLDGPMPAGSHEAVLEAEGLPSGPYVLRLHAAGEILSRTITLVR